MDTNKKRFVIVATCLVSKFKDVQVAIAVDAEDAKHNGPKTMTV